jgi:hypothetical protein
VIRDIAESLFDSVRSVAARSITYRRGALSTPLTVVPGVTQFQVTDDQQIVEEFRSRDFLILASELVLSGTRITPQRGDKIDESFAGTTERYEVMAPSKDQQPFRYSDAAKTILRVFTKQIS